MVLDQINTDEIVSNIIKNACCDECECEGEKVPKDRVYIDGRVRFDQDP